MLILTAVLQPSNRLLLSNNLDHFIDFRLEMVDLVQQGISEKVALVVMFLSAFFTGFILAYARNWRLALALSSIIPCIAIMGGVMNRFISRYMQ